MDFIGTLEHWLKKEHKMDKREELIMNIESMTGVLYSVPYHKVSTKDLEKIYNALRRNR